MGNVQVQVIRTPRREEFFKECMESLCGDNVVVSVDKFGPHLTTRLDFVDRAVEDYVAFVDDDDVVVPGTISTLLCMLSTADSEFVGVHSHEAFTSVTGDRLKSQPVFNIPFALDTALQKFHFPRVAILRTDVAQQVSRLIRTYPAVWGYIYPEFSIMALAGLLGKWLEVPEVGYLYRLHPGNYIRTIPHSLYRTETDKLVRGIHSQLNQ